MPGQGPPDVQPDPIAPSLAKGLFLGELHQDLATPFPMLDARSADTSRVEGANDVLRSFISLSGLTSQVATLSRATALMNDEGADATATERFIAETYCTRAARRVDQQFALLQDNDDDPMNQVGAGRRPAWWIRLRALAQ